jgi:dihydroneopterin aldolase
MTHICLDGLEVDCTIGVFDPERNKTQPVTVHIEVHLDTSAAAREDALFRTRDYGALSNEISFILQSGRFYLLEAAAQVLLRWLLLPPAEGSPTPPIEFARVRLAKPDALPGGAVAVVQVEGKASDQSWEREEKPWGRVDIVQETRRAGLYRLTLQPGGELPTHHHLRMREAELVLDAGLVGWKDGGTPGRLPVGLVLTWNHEQSHGYRNEGTAPASLLCLDAPPFDPRDEILHP